MRDSSDKLASPPEGTREDTGGPVQAVIFDLDGTLVDSEGLTDPAIEAELRARGILGAALPPQDTRGRTWADIAQALLARYPGAGEPGELAAALERRWIALADLGIAPVPGAVAALAQARRVLPLAVVSSSPRAVIDAFLTRIGAAEYVDEEARIGAGDVVHPKPAPDGFRLAAARLGVRAEACVVFEDSVAGLQAARAAGMTTVAVLHACAQPERCRALACRGIMDYRVLPHGLWTRLAAHGSKVLSEPW